MRRCAQNFNVNQGMFWWFCGIPTSSGATETAFRTAKQAVSGAKAKAFADRAVIRASNGPAEVSSCTSAPGPCPLRTERTRAEITFNAEKAIKIKS